MSTPAPQTPDALNATNEMQAKREERPLYALIQNGEAGEPSLITFFTTEAERDKATRLAIMGNATDKCPELEELRESGCVHFEGDPSVFWDTMLVTGWNALPALELAERALRLVLESVFNPETCMEGWVEIHQSAVDKTRAALAQIAEARK